MKKDFMPVIASTTAKKVLFAIFCCTLLMLFTAPAWAQDPCTPALPVGRAGTGPNTPACGVLITITGTTGNLTATITGGGAANGNSYDGSEDELIGIQNSTGVMVNNVLTGAVTIGAIRLSAPPLEGDNLFQFDGDGPCNYAFYTNQSSTDCFNNEVPSSFQNSSTDPFDYEGPNNIFTGISADYTTGTVHFITPISPGGSTWFALEETPSTVVSIGETQVLATGVPNVFPFGPFTCTSECGPGSGTWQERTALPAMPAVDDFVLTPISALTPGAVDYWTVLPIPVPAGPLGTNTFESFTIDAERFFGPGQFGQVTPTAAAYGPPSFFTEFPNFPTNPPPPNQNSLACSPYTDYSLAAALASGGADGSQPTCVELERSCIGPDCGTVTWEAQFDYDQDSNSIPFLVGGPAALYVPDVPGPTSPVNALPFSGGATDFTQNAINSYTGATPTPEGTLPQDKPPTKASGGGGKSVFVAAFSPNVSQTPADQIPNGVTVGFPGFEVPTSNTSSPSCSKEAAQYLVFPSGKQVSVGAIAPVNCLFAVKNHKGVEVPVPWLLVWDDTTTSNTAITNVQLCQTVVVVPNVGPTCPALAATANWVHLSLVPVNCPGFAGQDPLSGAFLNLNPLFPGQYTFLWEPVSNRAGCEVAPLLEFNNNGTITYASPAVFEYSF
jgi:hypothetical protein